MTASTATLVDAITLAARSARAPSAAAAAPVDQPRIEADLDLLRRYAVWADADAFAEIVRRYVNAVYAAALRVLGDSARAEDASQETFFRLMRRPYDVRQNLGAWLHRTATHVALDCLRSESSRRKRESIYTHECQREASTWSELSPAVDQALTELPEELRSLLVAHFLLGRTQSQLADETRLSPATISRRIHQGLDELRVRLRLKGLYALPAALAALLSHASARPAPASLLHELGKITLVSSASVRDGLPYTPRRSSVHRALAANHPNIWLAIIGFLTAIMALQFLTGEWKLPQRLGHDASQRAAIDAHVPTAGDYLHGMDPMRRPMHR